MLPIPLSTVNGMPELLLPKDVMDLCTLSCLVSLMTNVLHGCPGLEMLPLSMEHNEIKYLHFIHKYFPS